MSWKDRKAQAERLLELELDAREKITGAKTFIVSDHASIHVNEGYSAYITTEDLSDTYNILFETGSERFVHQKNIDVWTSTAQALLRVYEQPEDVAHGDAVAPINRRRLHNKASETIISSDATVNTISSSYNINGLDAEENTVSVDGDQTGSIQNGDIIEISGSTDNNGIYYVIDVDFDDTNTVITVKEEIDDTTADGELSVLRLIEEIRLGGGGDKEEASGPPGGITSVGGNFTLDIEWVFRQNAKYLFQVVNESEPDADIGVWLYWYEEEDG